MAVIVVGLIAPQVALPLHLLLADHHYHSTRHASVLPTDEIARDGVEPRTRARSVHSHPDDHSHHCHHGHGHRHSETKRQRPGTKPSPERFETDHRDHDGESPQPHPAQDHFAIDSHGEPTAFRTSGPGPSHAMYPGEPIVFPDVAIVSRAFSDPPGLEPPIFAHPPPSRGPPDRTQRPAHSTAGVRLV